MNQLFADLPLPVAIVGLGVTGTAVQELLNLGGIPRDQVLTFDEKAANANYRTSDDLIALGNPKTLVVSPGVPLASPWIQAAKNRGVVITSELSLASRILTTERVIAITGSVGKSTTTCLLRAGLEAFSSAFFVGGNLGIPLANYACELIKGQHSVAEWVVLELSSYQLENFPELKAEFSILTFLTSNHLERYPSKEAYFQTKWNIETHTQKFFILNKNGGELKDWAQLQKPQRPWVWTDRNSVLVNQYRLNDCQLLGSHNLDNIAMAAEVAHLAQWPKSAFDGIKEFRGLPHRVENLGLKRGIRFINDSKATTMESVKIAVTSVLESLQPQHTLHLLLGGKDKNLPWEELAPLKNHPNLRFYFFGECRRIAQSKSGLPGDSFQKMLEATEEAVKKATLGDSILLSPGGTSLDEYKNFEHRGDAFRAFVSALP